MSLILGARRSIEDYVLDYEFDSEFWKRHAVYGRWILISYDIKKVYEQNSLVTILDPTWLSKTSDPWMIYSHRVGWQGGLGKKGPQ
jgi:hypothetical protein